MANRQADRYVRNGVPRVVALVLGAALLLLGGCASTFTPQNDPIEAYAADYGYRYTNVQGPADDDGVLVSLSFSGGGTRAAALSYGVLKVLAETNATVGGRRRRPLDAQRHCLLDLERDGSLLDRDARPAPCQHRQDGRKPESPAAGPRPVRCRRRQGLPRRSELRCLAGRGRARVLEQPADELSPAVRGRRSAAGSGRTTAACLPCLPAVSPRAEVSCTVLRSENAGRQPSPRRDRIMGSFMSRLAGCSVLVLASMTLSA